MKTVCPICGLVLNSAASKCPRCGEPTQSIGRAIVKKGPAKSRRKEERSNG